MASLQARHSRSCPLYPWTSFAKATKAKGCKCPTANPPLYYVVSRRKDNEKKLVRHPVGHNRREALNALDAIRGDIAHKTYKVVADIAFDAFADRWLAALTGKRSTHDAYAVSITYAKATFGAIDVRAIDAGDVTRFLNTIRDASTRQGRVVSDDTLAKHLRHLSACLGAAMSENYATENAVAKLHKTVRPKTAKKRPSYFTDGELAALWAAIEHRPVYSNFFRAAYTSGVRFGELAAATWGDVDLLNTELRISRSYSYGYGEDTPKSGEARTVDLTPEALAVFEAWYALNGDDGGLIFASETGGHLDPSYTRRVLYKALDVAGIARVGEGGRKRTLHSLRHSFARVALENGAPLQWVSRQMGHSSVQITDGTYGFWSREAQKSEAAKLAGAFGL